MLMGMVLNQIDVNSSYGDVQFLIHCSTVSSLSFYYVNKVKTTERLSLINSTEV